MIKVAGILAITLGESLVAGFVLKTLWLWFVVSTFKLPELSIPVALGLALLYRYLSLDTNLSRKGDRSIEDQAFFGMAMALIFLGIGFVIHLFV